MRRFCCHRPFNKINIPLIRIPEKPVFIVDSEMHFEIHIKHPVCEWCKSLGLRLGKPEFTFPVNDKTYYMTLGQLQLSLSYEEKREGGEVFAFIHKLHIYSNCLNEGVQVIFPLTVSSH